MIEGNNYSVSFSNKTGVMTPYFTRIIEGVAEGIINITDDEIQRLREVDEVLSNDENSDLNISITFNTGYPVRTFENQHI